MKLLITNGNIILVDRILFNGSIVVCDGVIEEILSTPPLNFDGEIVDAKGDYISPGFVETHCHGGMGWDFMDADEAEMKKIADFHASHGVTTLLATSTAAPFHATIDFIQKSKRYLDAHSDGVIYGVHLEGPYLNTTQCGAQNPEYIYPPDTNSAEQLFECADTIIKRFSIAPETDKDYALSKECLRRGVVLSAAHTDADCAQIIDAFDNGYCLLTHFYSGMNSVTRKSGLRIAGAVEAGYLLDDMSVEIIADGKHLPAHLLNLIYKIKGADKIILTTDASAAAGAENSTNLRIGGKNGLPIIVEDGVAKLPDRCSLAGSIATTNQLVGNMSQLTSAPLHEIVKMLTLNPSKLLNIESRLGSLAYGKQADIILFNKDFTVNTVIKKGRVINTLQNS